MKRHHRRTFAFIVVALSIGIFILVLLQLQPDSQADLESDPEVSSKVIGISAPAKDDTRAILHNSILKASFHNETHTASMHDRFAFRLERVRSVCSKYDLNDGFYRVGKDSSEFGADSPKFQMSRYGRPWSATLLYNEDWKLTYCWLHKVASSSWNEVFFRLAGVNIAKRVGKKNLHTAAERLRPHTPAELYKAVGPESLKFLVVRHPFKRLASAYVDKFELGPTNDFIFREYNPRIALADVGLDNKYARPTFVQFVDYLLKTDVAYFNDHWMPYWLHCRLCVMDYDVVAKIETLSDDFDFIAAAAGLTEELPWHNQIKERKGKQPKYESLEDYFTQELDLVRVTALYEVYKVDFEMFGYTTEGFVPSVVQRQPHIKIHRKRDTSSQSRQEGQGHARLLWSSSDDMAGLSRSTQRRMLLTDSSPSSELVSEIIFEH